MSARRVTMTVLVSLGAWASLLALGAGSAGAVVSQFGSKGTEAGQFVEIHGIAVNQSNGNVYVADTNNNRIEEFTSEGSFLMAWGSGVADGVTRAPQTCTTVCYRGLGGTRGGEFAEYTAQGIAVDNDPLSPSYGDVYVGETYNNERVDKFSPTGTFLAMYGGKVNENGTNVCLAGEKCQAGQPGIGNGEFNSYRGAIAVDSSGNLYVGDQGRVQEFNSSGIYVKSISIAGGSVTREVAVDSIGDLYELSYGSNGVHEYDSSGTLLRTFDTEGGSSPLHVALDDSGHVLVDNHGENSSHEGIHEILEYDSAGTELATFDSGMEDARGGMVYGESIKRLYVASPNAVRLLALPSPGVQLVGGQPASEIEPVSATLSATVNPENHVTKYRFEYGPTSSYGSSAPIPDGSLSASFENDPVKVTLTKLRAGTLYHYRIVASDSEGHVATSPDQSFTTLPAVSIDHEYATGVASTSATLGAQLNPLGANATYRIEYDTTGYTFDGPDHGIQLPEASLGSGFTEVTASGVYVEGLTPHTLYHFRVVAQDEREGILYTVDGPDETFTTQPGGGALRLADGRMWELVSQADKQGARIHELGEGSVIEAAVNGSAFTYVTNAPTELDPAGNGSEIQVLSRHGGSGWTSHDLAVPANAAIGIQAVTHYMSFSSDLSSGYLAAPSPNQPILSAQASVSTTPYLQDLTCEGQATTSDCYVPLLTSKEGYADVPPGTRLDELGGGGESLITFEGATSDLRHIVLLNEGNASLTSTPASRWNLYEWSADKPPAERLALVSVLPEAEGGGATTVGAKLGGKMINESIPRDAITRDGSRVFWTELSDKHIYMRDLAKGESLRLDVPQPGVTGADPGSFGRGFQFATSDGTKAFFTDEQRLTRDSGASPESKRADLYECEIVEEAGKLACKLTDLTPVNAAGERAAVRFLVVGATEDGSYIYFVADAALAPGATPSECSVTAVAARGCNLYVLHDGAMKFVARLTVEDSTDWAGFSNSEGELNRLSARMSPNGRYLAFMSEASLTGYDNLDANSGRPDQEVYLYDAQTSRLVCASCNPSGARPVGVEAQSNANRLVTTYFNEGSWFAASLPIFTTLTYQSRYLSDEGRLSFNSNDALVPQDINGTMDVYEYEPLGVGSCSTMSVTYDERAGGCVGLVSAGSSPKESAFLDASETGEDIFFLTGDKLVPQDADTALDVYDAHVCSSGWGCVSSSVSPPACTTADACRSAPSPQPASFGAPASATFAGAGNVSQGAPRTVKPKSLTRVNGRRFLPTDGHRFSPLVAIFSPHWWP
ncbi:MAG: hypothetical protein ACRDK4_04865 [Solirubrobacteraceae bacterium]